ncbi:hypothetical protein KLA_05447 [Cellulophaga geojensis KL-A]|uniref:Uncharacterized protein n=2 Tax=Cellulophaga TaxID=104264 RepID=F0RFX4_CELLC|nr:hypothetical protein Celly_0099 [Cellulophaga lytica DSM 7489]EWH14089.1 hypothetical protein KLA_05447 [Cellulophaga geojensis KL-A]
MYFGRSGGLYAILRFALGQIRGAASIPSAAYRFKEK